MQPMLRWACLIAAGVGLCAGAVRGEAAEPEVSIAVVPMRYVFIDGDAGTFREHHWKKGGYTGGLQDLTIHHTFADGLVFESEAHALIDQNDVGAAASLKKDGLGFIDFDFTEFRKYYSGKGGVYQLFSTVGAPDTDKELQLDIGKLELETGLTLEGWPELTFGYEREYKDGTKSRLTWGEAEETPATGNATRNITPSWQEIDEIVDVISLGATHELAGVELTGEQRWEFVRSENVRQELDIATTGTSGADKLRRHEQDPESTLMTTLLGAERAFQDGNTLVSTAYRFGHMDNREFETIIESNSLTGAVTNFGFAEQKRDARSDVDYDTHTWVANSSLKLAESLSFITKMKAEVIKQQGNSSYPSYAETGGSPEAFDTVLDYTAVSLTDTKATRWGEGVSLRFTGIPRTALYTELELEQARVLLREDRQVIDGPDTGNDATAAAGDIFSRETVTDVRRGTWTLGGQVAPWSFLNVTAHVRHRRNNNDYDDQRETAFSSAFIDDQKIHTDEFMTRATYRPCRWLRSSVRYTFRDDDFSSSVQGQQIVKTGTRSHTYVYDVNLQPLRDLLLTGSFSRQSAATMTPAEYGATTSNIPTFNADVNTWLFSADYAAGEHLVLTSALQYARARNFNDDNITNGLRYGADFNQVDVTTGLTWSLREDASLTAEYGFYHYQPNSNWNAGDYDAHELRLEVSKAF